MKKLVSIALPAYNAGPYIGACLDCLLGQTYDNLEIVLMDDCSTDDTAQVVASYTDPRIRYYKNEENMGIVHTLNKAYGLCRGEYIARMDADDLCTLDRLEKQVALLEAMPDVGLVACDLELFGARTGLIQYSADPEVIKCRLLYSLQLAHNAWLFRRELLDVHALAYRDEYRYAEDWDFLVRASHVVRFSNVQEPLTGYRMFPNQSSKVHNQAQKAAADRVAKNQLDNLGVELSEAEFEAYRKGFGKGEVLLSEEHMTLLLQALGKLERANKTVRFYDPQVLHRVIREEVYKVCYFNLMNRQRSGLGLFGSAYYKGLKLGASMRCKLLLRGAVTSVLGK